MPARVAALTLLPPRFPPIAPTRLWAVAAGHAGARPAAVGRLRRAGRPAVSAVRRHAGSCGRHAARADALACLGPDAGGARRHAVGRHAALQPSARAAAGQGASRCWGLLAWCCVAVPGLWRHCSPLPAARSRGLAGLAQPPCSVLPTPLGSTCRPTFTAPAGRAQQHGQRHARRRRHGGHAARCVRRQRARRGHGVPPLHGAVPHDAAPAAACLALGRARHDAAAGGRSGGS